MQKIGGLGPLSRPFFPKSPGQNFYMTILFSIVEIPNNYIFEDDLIPHSPRGRAASYELCLLFTYSLVLVIGRYAEVLRGNSFW